MSEFDVAFSRIMAAATPEDVFGKIADGHDRIQVVGRLYRRLVLAVHPDHHPEDVARAGEAFQKLTRLRGEAEERLSKGLYWTKAPTPPPASKVDSGPIVVAVRGRRYALARMVGLGDVCELYRGGEGGADDLFFKVAQHPADNDLLENEAAVLKATAADPSSADAAPRSAHGLGHYVCALRDSFLLRSKTQSRRVNVLARADGYRSLAEVGRAYPRGLDYRDVAWMFKRTLAALWYLHRAGYVHGAVLPEHVLVHPTSHGAKLVDFCYAVKSGGIVKAISGPNRRLYAPEVLAKKAASPATDICMVAKVFLGLMASGKGAQAIFAGFLMSCNMANPSGRPNDAGNLHEEFDRLLRKHAGKPAYRALAMPPAEGE